MKFRSDRLIPARLFRQLRSGEFACSWRGVGSVARTGDFIDCEVLYGAQSRGLDLGPTVTPTALTRILGVPDIDDAQVVVSPPGEDREYVASTPLDLRSEIEGVEIREGDPSEPPDSDGEVVVFHPNYLPGLGLDGAASLLCAIGRHHRVRTLYGVSNRSEPCSLPLAGEPGSPHLKMPGGLSAIEIALALADLGVDFVEGVAPEAPPVAYWNMGTGASGEGTTARVYGWEPEQRGGAWPADGEWAGVVAFCRRVLPALPEDRPPVAIYSTATGPWGGVKVILRLADELQRRGVHAKLVHRSSLPHPFKTFTPPLKVRNTDVLARGWSELCGDDAILVASHWGAASTIGKIVDANPEAIPLCFLQDREDLFEQPKGRAPIALSAFARYLDVGRGVSVSRWVLDSGERDGIGIDPGRFRVIPPGIDLSIFHPRGGARGASDKVRVLAMWRPQTAHRRGADILRAAFEHVRSALGDSVSLEVFGWEGTGNERAPGYVTHHGPQSEEGVAGLMRDVDIVVEPSRFQGFGLPGLEAMACGATLISTPCLGVQEYAVNEENSLVVPHDRLGEGIVRAATDADLRARLSGRALADVMRFDWSRVADEWTRHLADLYLRERGDEGKWSGAWRRIRDALSGCDEPPHTPNPTPP